MTITDTQREVFTKVFSYLPHPCASVWIAGGAVVDYDTARDIDVFFGRYNQAAAYNFIRKLPYYKEFNSDYAGNFSALAEAYIPNISKTIQIIVTKADTADKGLAGFDISTCRWAVLSKGLLEVKGKDATASDRPPVVFKASDKTLGRYIKYCNRFGHPIDVEQVKKCVELVKVIKLKKKPTKVKVTKEIIEDLYSKSLVPYYSGLVDALGGPKPDPQAQANWNAQMLPAYYQAPTSFYVDPKAFELMPGGAIKWLPLKDQKEKK